MAFVVDGRTTRVGRIELLDRERPDLKDLEGLSGCSLLETLDLSGLCPNVKNLIALTHCPKLEVAELSGTAVTNLAPLRGCPRLHTLSLKFVTVLTDVSPLAGLLDLRELDLTHTSVEDVKPLGTLTRLEQLSLQGTNVKDASPLGSCPKLEYLNLHGALSLESIDGLDGCTALKTLDVRRGWEIGDKAIGDALVRLPESVQEQFEVYLVISGLYHLKSRGTLRKRAHALTPEEADALALGTTPLLDIGRVATSGGSVPYSPRTFSVGPRGTPRGGDSAATSARGPLPPKGGS